MRWFGAKADWNGATDGSCSGTDNSSAVQSALDYLHGLGGGDVSVPDGRYFFKNGLKLYSHTRILISAGASLGVTSIAGASANAFIKPLNHLGSSYADGCLFNLVGEASAQYYHTASVLMMVGRFYSNAGSNLGLVYADPVDAPVVRNCQLESRWLNSSAGYLLYDTYTQQCSVRFGRSDGPIDRALELVGNVVSIYDVDLESTGGTAPGYFIKLGRTGVQAGANIRLCNTIIECSTGPNKKHMMIQNTQNVWIENYWAESSGGNSVLWDLDGALRTEAVGFILGPGSGSTLNLVNGSSLFFADQLFTGSRDVNSAIVCDATSFVEIGSSWTGTADNAIVLPEYDYKSHVDVRFNRAIAESPSSYPNYAARLLQQNLQGENLFQNPNFLAGEFGWAFGGSASYGRTYVKSAFGTGRACKLTFTSSGYATLTQRLTLTSGDDGSGKAKYAGQAITIAMRVRFITSSGTEWASPYFQSSDGNINQSNATARGYAGVGTEQVVAQTVLIPPGTAANTVLDVGIWIMFASASTSVVVGKALCIVGGEGVIAAGAQQMIDLGPLPIFTSPSIPVATVGMPKGAFAFNSNPGSNDAVLGWRFNGTSWQSVSVTIT